MLTHLQIRDFAIVESVELELGRGFTALTGETGAGKSILVDALLLAAGGRADSGAVRHGADRAEVSATFDVSRNGAAKAWLAEQAIEHEGECVVRRVVGSDGRGRAYLNGQTVPLQSLRALGELLVDIHGQLEFQSLSRRSYQRETLDGSGKLADLAHRVREAYRAWRGIDEERSRFEQSSRDRDHRLELLRHYVKELDALEPKANEAESLAEERKRMASLGRLAEATAQVEALLGGDDGGASAALSRAQSIVRQLVSLDATLASTAQMLDEAAIASREALASVRSYSNTLDADPARQDWLEARLAALESVGRKHRVEVAELPALRESLIAELKLLENAAVSEAELMRRLVAARDAYVREATRLTEARQVAAIALDRKVSGLMQGLGMAGGVFATSVEPHDPVEFSEHGNDEIEFLVSANPGQPPRPLAKVASGGELSRISLALQVAALEAAHLPCLVFDEVDAGVGGAVAEMVGRQLRALAVSGQVLCVTHLPQVASQADHQIRVSKLTADGTTRTRIEALAPEARVEEIARMLGGTSITARTREHAREMLDSVQEGANPSAGRGLKPSSAGKGRTPSRTGRAM
jgi:DNA repair protein RecN (Recombination protein N)